MNHKNNLTKFYQLIKKIKRRTSASEFRTKINKNTKKLLNIMTKRFKLILNV